MDEKEETITISLKHHDILFKAFKELKILEAYGVDNWEGYGEAMAELYGEENEDD